MNNTIKLGCGLVVSLTLGLSGCYMDSPYSQRPENVGPVMTAPSTSKTVHSTTTTTVKTEKQAAKEPLQQTTPGPKRTAAPQIPVIQ